jgi:hypothetical protein
MHEIPDRINTVKPRIYRPILDFIYNYLNVFLNIILYVEKVSKDELYFKKISENSKKLFV